MNNPGSVDKHKLHVRWIKMSPQGFKTPEYTFRTILISECYSVNVHAKTLYLTILHVCRYEVREQIRLCVHACVMDAEVLYVHECKHPFMMVYIALTSLYIAILHSQADSLHYFCMWFWMSDGIPSELFAPKVVYSQCYLAATWLVPCETAAILAHVLRIQPCTRLVSLHAKPHT